MKKIVILLFCIASASYIDCNDINNEKEEILLKFEEVQNDQEQQNEPQSEEQFVAVHVNQMNVDMLNPNSLFVEEMVRPFLSSHLHFQCALSATREIVNGFKYEITFVMKNTENDEEIYCLMDILEKPWLMNKTRKFRKMTYNNCSLENPMDEEDLLRFEYEINPTFIDQRTDLSESELTDMEDQIITERSTTTEVNDDAVTLSPLDPSSKNILDDFFHTNNYFPPQSTASPEEMITVRKIEHSHSSSSSSNGDELQQRTDEIENSQKDKNDIALRELETEIKRAFSELFQTNSEFQMNIIALINRNDDSMAQKNYNYVINMLASKLKDKIESYNERSIPSHKVQEGERLPPGAVGAPYDTDDHTQALKLLNENLERLDTGSSDTPLELVQIESVKQQVVAGIKYIVKGAFKVGDDQKKCTVEVWHRAWIHTEERTQLKADCQEGGVFTMKTTRTKRSAHHHHHGHNNRENRQLKADHLDDHHHHHDRQHHHYSATEQMKEVKSEILFDNFIEKYNRKYLNDQEHKMRMRIFKKNLHKIEMLNKHEQGTAKYGITEFADMTEKEYLHRTGLLVPVRHDNDLGNPTAHIPEIEDLPTEFDWREKAAVTDVKNQGNCGSCWSFSVTGNIEGLHAIKTGKLEAYSEQELLDCDTTDNACNGGYMDDAFKAIEKIGGLELEDEYPYLAKKQKKCQFNATMSHVKVKGVVDIPKGDEVAMQKFLVSTGPISIGINANAMQFYRGGVSHPWKVLCRKSNLDHGVLIVGFGIKEYPLFNKTLPYWTIKNSWGPKWGEQGYYRVYRGDNSCGVAEMASSAVLE